MMWSKVLGGMVCLAALAGCSVHYYVARPVADPQVVHVPSAPYVAPENAVDTGASLSLVLILPAGTANPGSAYIWVEPYSLQEDVVVPGFWRLRDRAGFIWVDGYWNGAYFCPGYWKPLKSCGSQWVWVPGHWWGKYWIEGKWRPAKRTGYTWREGHWTRNGEWEEGYWVPVKSPKPGLVWVPGFWLANGTWKEGYWRPERREGFIWIGGYFNGQGIWVVGSWQAAPPAHRWVPGYWDPRGLYTPGRLDRDRDDADFVPGHYNRRNNWVPERWQERNTGPRQPQPSQPDRRTQPPQQTYQQPEPYHQPAVQTRPYEPEVQAVPPRVATPEMSGKSRYQKPSRVEPQAPAPNQYPGDVNADQIDSPESDRGMGRDKTREAEKTPGQGVGLGQERRQEVGNNRPGKQTQVQQPARSQEADSPDLAPTPEPEQNQGQKNGRKEKPTGNKDRSGAAVDTDASNRGQAPARTEERSREMRSEDASADVQPSPAIEDQDSQPGKSQKQNSGKGRTRK
ncbi:MAG: hypothetical protein AB1439_05715 [candidate division FCPU426 bacterium]